MVVWLAGSVVYAVAVAQRSTIGVAGPAATERYGVSLAVLSVLPITQLVLYAALQIPAGQLLDRLGARATLTAGAVLIATGQFVLATTDHLWIACCSRLLVSAGDSVAFVSALRLVLLRLPGRRATLFAQLTGVLGQVGAIAAAAPFASLLRWSSWTTAFVLAGCVSIVAAVVAAAVIREPRDLRAGDRVDARLTTLWEDPGTRLGFWVHFTMTFPTTGFLLYWGLPYLLGSGLSVSTAGYVLSAVSVAGMAVGLGVGIAVARWPNRGFCLCSTFVVVIGASWAAALVWPSPPPWLPVAVALTTGASAPFGVVAFKYLRPGYSVTTSSFATGLVNSGGFLSSLVAIAAVAGLGSLISMAGGTRSSGLVAQFVLWVVGLAMMARSFGAFRRRVVAFESDVVVGSGR